MHFNARKDSNCVLLIVLLEYLLILEYVTVTSFYD